MMRSFQMAVGMQLLWFNVDVYFVVLVISHFRIPYGWFLFQILLPRVSFPSEIYFRGLAKD